MLLKAPPQVTAKDTNSPAVVDVKVAAKALSSADLIGLSQKDNRVVYIAAAADLVGHGVKIPKPILKR